MDVDWSD